MEINTSEPWASDNSNIACLFSFPFPVYVDTESGFSLTEQKIEDETVRIYPFFRSGPANFNPDYPLGREMMARWVARQFGCLRGVHGYSMDDEQAAKMAANRPPALP